MVAAVLSTIRSWLLFNVRYWLLRLLAFIHSAPVNVVCKGKPRDTVDTTEQYGDDSNESRADGILSNTGAILLEGSSSSTGDSLSIYLRVDRGRATVDVELLLDGRRLNYSADSPFSPTSPEDEHAIEIGALRLERREPFLRWRIHFRGLMKEAGTERFVRLSGWWRSLSDVWSPEVAVRRNMIRQLAEDEGRTFSDCRDIVSASCNVPYTLAQWGESHLEVTVDDTVSRRQRFRGVRTVAHSISRADVRFISCYFPDGIRLFYQWIAVPQYNLTLSGGVVHMPDHSQHYLHVDQPQPTHFDFQTEKWQPLRVQFCSGDSDSPVTDVEPATAVSINRPLVTLKSSTTRAIRVHLPVSSSTTLHQTSSSSPSAARKSTQSKSPPPSSALLVRLDDPAAENPLLCGGKGAQLATLTGLVQSADAKFTVPRGLVVTTVAFEHFISQLPDCNSQHSIADHIRNLNKKDVPKEVRRALRDEVQHLFPDESTLLAVRSSAVGEDGEMWTAAGQLTSYLNVTRDEVVEKLLECWLSNFGDEIVSYRRTHGQPEFAPMAVVVQEMARSGAAGVLFTQHPTTGHPRHCVLNAVRGCGELVVSGHSTPLSVVLHVQPDGTIAELERTSETEETVISTDDIRRIVVAGKWLEERLARAQDIEWVLSEEGNLQLVQTRAITQLDSESRHELLTEFDDPQLTEHEILSTGNVGEVLPTAMTPLSVDIVGGYLKRALARTEAYVKCLPDTTQFTFRTLLVRRQRLLFNVGEMLLRGWQDLERSRIIEIAYAGRTLITDDMLEKHGKRRFPPAHQFQKMRELLAAVKLLLFDSHRLLDRAQRLQRALRSHIPREEPSAVEAFAALKKCRRALEQIAWLHTRESMFSSFTYILLGIMLEGEKQRAVGGDPSPRAVQADVLADVAAVYSKVDDVISAEVPVLLVRIARQLVRDKIDLDFGQQSDEAAIQWLLHQKATSAVLLGDLLHRHGHRGASELYVDVFQTWSRQHVLLAKQLKALVTREREQAAATTTMMADEKSADRVDLQALVSKLQWAPKNSIGQWVLRMFISQAHRGVRFRELAKNELVLATDHTRNVLESLQEATSREGILHDPQLLSFMTVSEIGRFLQTRDGVLLSRAIRRRRILEEQRLAQFPHIHWGFVEPQQDEKSPASTDNDDVVKLQGTVVCHGRVRGIARVAKTLDDARLTENGEILIARYTDIGWSPLFPLVRGLVTEIGGLLSHGAVVAREYGLPSLIAVGDDATRLFQTGDEVLLDTDTASITLISRNRH